VRRQHARAASVPQEGVLRGPHRRTLARTWICCRDDLAGDALRTSHVAAAPRGVRRRCARARPARPSLSYKLHSREYCRRPGAEPPQRRLRRPVGVTPRAGRPTRAASDAPLIARAGAPWAPRGFVQERSIHVCAASCSP
jgi:hypothetical protein